MSSVVIIRGVREEWGVLGNMSPGEVIYDGRYWPRSEHLFQALRLSDADLQEEIRLIANPMAAKFASKRIRRENPDKVRVTPMSEEDLDLMRLVLRLKHDQNDEVQATLRMTKQRTIVEDCTKRQRGSGMFWGAALQADGSWKGLNWLGVLWGELRVKVS